MCSIGGYISFSTSRPNRETLETLFTDMQVRGKDASGFAYIQGRKSITVKAAETSTELIKKQSWANLFKQALPNKMIFHTRAATQGDEKINDNNHPLLSKQNYPYVHNGMINNGHEFGIFRDVVDSLAIREVYEGSYQDLPDKLKGSWTVAMLQPKKIVIWRHSNPVNFFYDKEIDTLFFASTEGILKGILPIEDVKGFLMPSRMWSISDDTYIEIDEKNGLTFEKPFVPVKASYEYVDYPKYSYQNYYTKDDDDACTLFKNKPIEVSELNRINGNLILTNLKAIKCPLCRQIHLEGYVHDCLEY